MITVFMVETEHEVLGYFMNSEDALKARTAWDNDPRLSTPRIRQVHIEDKFCPCMLEQIPPAEILYSVSADGGESQYGLFRDKGIAEQVALDNEATSFEAPVLTKYCRLCKEKR